MKFLRITFSALAMSCFLLHDTNKVGVDASGMFETHDHVALPVTISTTSSTLSSSTTGASGVAHTSPKPPKEGKSDDKVTPPKPPKDAPLPSQDHDEDDSKENVREDMPGSDGGSESDVVELSTNTTMDEQGDVMKKTTNNNSNEANDTGSDIEQDENQSGAEKFVDNINEETGSGSESGPVSATGGDEAKNKTKTTTTTSTGNGNEGATGKNDSETFDDVVEGDYDDNSSDDEKKTSTGSKSGDRKGPVEDESEASDADGGSVGGNKGKAFGQAKTFRSVVRTRATLRNLRHRRPLNNGESFYLEDSLVNALTVVRGATGGTTSQGSVQQAGTWSVRSVIVENEVANGAVNEQSTATTIAQPNDRKLLRGGRRQDMETDISSWRDVWAVVESSCYNCYPEQNDDGSENDDGDSNNRRLENSTMEEITHLEKVLCDLLQEGPYEMFHDVHGCKLIFVG